MPKNKPLVIAIMDADITQTELAKKTGLHESRLSRIVNGHDDATEDEKKLIARALRMPIRQVFPEVAA